MQYINRLVSRDVVFVIDRPRKRNGMDPIDLPELLSTNEFHFNIEHHISHLPPKQSVLAHCCTILCIGSRKPSRLRKSEIDHLDHHWRLANDLISNGIRDLRKKSPNKGTTTNRCKCMGIFYNLMRGFGVFTMAKISNC